jgi:transposase-like protein
LEENTLAKRTRKKYSAEMKAKILAAAKAEGLTATDVKRKFGVTPVTYYSWRKTSRSAPRGPRAKRNTNLEQQLRGEVREHIQKLLPEIIRSEAAAHLHLLFSGGRRVGRGKKK